jgi:hypothetical protein
VGELLPVLGGLLVGALLFQVRGPGRRLRPALVCAVLIGAATSWVNGELDLSVSFLGVDIPTASLGIAIGGRLRDRAADVGRPAARESAH